MLNKTDHREVAVSKWPIHCRPSDRRWRYDFRSNVQ